jgi:hypothetical protein
VSFTEEIAATLASCSASSAPGDDEIPFSFLKALGEPVTRALTPFLKRARTIVIKKPGKDSYETPSAWRPIELLKKIGKVIEKVVAKRIREAEEAIRTFFPYSRWEREQGAVQYVQRWNCSQAWSGLSGESRRGK